MSPFGGQGSAAPGPPHGPADGESAGVNLRMHALDDDALMALASAFRQLFLALRNLAIAEARVMQAGIPLFFMAAVALVAFSVSLWVCLVALIGWALMRGTHSPGLALGLLVVIHAILVFGVWSVIKYSIRQATFPRARAELRMIGRTALHDLGRFTGKREAVRGAPADAAPDKEGTA